MASESNLQIAETESAREEQRRLAIFSQRLFERLPPEAAAAMSADQRARLAADALEFFAVRAEPVKLRVQSGDEHGAGAFVESAMPDCPFIVDSLLEYFHQTAIGAGMLLHPVLSVARDAAGRLVSLESGRAIERPESFVHLELRPQGALHDPERIAADLRVVLEEVRRVTDDFEAMSARALEICEETAAQRELVEVRDLLRWLVGGGFVFLGYRRYRLIARDGHRALEAVPDSGLGLLREHGRSRYAAPVDLDALEPAQRALLFDGPALIIGKSRSVSRVHRRRLMDDITLRRSGDDGQPIGFDRFLGLFTSKAYAEEAQHIPVLRAKLREVIEAERATPGSHNYKELVTAFNSFPKEELFRAPVAELRDELRLILELKDEAAVRLSVRYDAVRGNVVVLVIMPRESFSAEVRKQIQAALGRILAGDLIYYYLALGEGYSARLHFCFAAASPTAAQMRAMETEVAALARTWEERLREELLERFGTRRANALAQRWLGAFSSHYRASTTVARAAADIEQIENLLAGGRSFNVELVRQGGGGAAHEGALHSELRMYELGEALRLSDVMPMLSNFGISVISEEAHELRAGAAGGELRVFVQSFRVQGPGGQPLESMSGAGAIAEALTAVRSGRAEDGPLNALVLGAGLGWREVGLLRAYVAAAFQMRLGASLPALRRVLLLNPRLARMLVEMFELRMDPAPAAEERERRAGELRAAYLAALSAIDNLADDRIARAFLGMIEATVRTNYFRTPPALYLSLKFESARIPNLPDTPPLYEIHVDSPTMAGCHLRAGRIARGGIRYSDRPEDFRTEILDLMKTQTVKNAIIVPTGAKGGFIVKPRPGAAPTREEVVEAYKTLIRAMLELTDNVIDGRVVHPEGVRVLDQDGPYLVVAADKGTAAFSDLANAIAEEHNFWLGDAFASGGRHGYDHKALGITARGAWESARWHLREMGIELGRGAPVTMVGIGDMSGDVFGNGLLRSDHVKLIAAFDHRHIFIDPDPDPKASFAERKRLFELPNSQWSDYNPALLSRGGGVFRRGAKTIVLSPEARRALGCEAEALDSDSLIQAVLRADVTLLYNGGIGTYVRASDERDAEVGDHANDACRITARELRAKIVVEGGNLGFTQRARIEYAMAGGRINTDAIDNSAGVDTSDHEVNLKILLQPALQRGRITPERRNRALAEAADEVVALVLGDNRDQVVLLSLEQLRSRTQASIFRDHLSAIEQRGVLRRYESALPSHEELRERRGRYPGLTRPELAVLCAYTKIDLFAQLESCHLLDDPYLTARFLTPYFPASIARDFADEIPRHGLRRELIVTTLVNRMVDLMGASFIFRLARSRGVRTEEVVHAWIFADGVLELREQAERLRADAGGLGAQAELAALLALEGAAAGVCGWAVGALEAGGALGPAIARFKPGFQSLCAQFETMLAAGERERFERLYRELRATVYTEEVAHQLARLGFADHLLSVLSLSLAHGTPPAACAHAYFALSDLAEFAALEAALETIGIDDRWERQAAEDLGAQLRAARLALCRAVLAERGMEPVEAVRALRRGREREFDAAAEVMGELRTMPAIGLPVLQVAVRALARLAHAASGAGG
ncbi:MAG TPA: NAD-glutamate dehydrogenase domain-containing protein [Candidatus Binataceae bacterium]|nr:NAD-glutamate dehydrogenase domain-containing protein [Candidatus Binataceae bacterium]